MSLKNEVFTVYFISDNFSKREKYISCIGNYFTKVELVISNPPSLLKIEKNFDHKSIILLDAALPKKIRAHLLDSLENKFPIIWLSEDTFADEAVKIFDEGKVNNVCFFESKPSIINAILRELKSLHIHSQLEVLSEQSTIISDVALNTHTAVITTDANGFTLWVNKAHTYLTGYTLNEMLGKKPSEILQGPDTDPSTIAYISTKLKEQIPFSVEILNYHKNGKKVWLKLDITPIFKKNKLDRFIGFQEDITEKKRNKLQLSESLKRLKRAQRIGKMCDWEMKTNSYIISWFGQAQNILGTEHTENIDYRSFIDLLNDKCAKKLQTAFNNIQKLHKNFDLILHLNSLNGEPKVVRMIGVPFLKNEKLQKIVGIIQDITIQHKAETLALTAQEQLLSVTNNMQAGFARIVVNESGKHSVFFANKGFYDLYEIEEESSKNNLKLIYNLTHKDDKLLTIPEIQLEILKTGKSVNQYYRIITPSGKLKWIHLISILNKNKNNEIYHDLIVTDITDKILKDRLLEEISEASLNGGWELDLISNKLTWTNVTKQIHEVPNDFIPNVETAINFYKEGKSRESIRKLFNEICTTGVSKEGQFEIITAKGNHKWVRVKGVAEFAGDRIVRVYGFFQDITLALERELAIIESLNEKKALLGEIHHRIKNNLSVISGLLQLELMKEDKSQLSLEEAINRIQSIAAVHEILYSTENFHDIYLDLYIDKLTQNIANTHPSLNHNIQLLTEIEKISIDAHKAVPIGLILNELITNSLKHAFVGNKRGSINIIVKKIDCSKIELKYYDSGEGFNEDLLEKKNSLGHKLILLLIQQLDAKSVIKTKNGFYLECTFETESKELVQLI